MSRKPLKDYEGYYEIDADGSIYSVERVCMNSLGRLYKYKARKLKPISHGTGYQVINLCRDGKMTTKRLHRVIAENLIDNPENKPYVNHIDGNKHNNTPSNLEWVTAQENTDHAVSMGLFDVVGFNNPYSKFTHEDAQVMQKLIEYGLARKEIAKAFDCDRNTVRRCLSRLNGK